MMKKWSGFVVLFLLLYGVLLLVTAPANVLLSQIQLPPNINIAGVSGSIWQTKIKQVSTEQFSINDIRASLSFWSLLRFKPSVQLNFGGGLVDGPEGKANVSIAGQSIELAELTLSVPAQELAQQLNLPIAMDATGLVQLTIEHYVSGKPLCTQLTGNLVWQAAEVFALEQQVKFGSLAAQLSCEQGAVLAKLNENNELGVNFSLAIHSATQVSGNGYVTPTDNFPKPLRELLPFLGSPDHQGRYRLAL